MSGTVLQRTKFTGALGRKNGPCFNNLNSIHPIQFQIKVISLKGGPGNRGIYDVYIVN